MSAETLRLLGSSKPYELLSFRITRCRNSKIKTLPCCACLCIAKFLPIHPTRIIAFPLRYARLFKHITLFNVSLSEKLLLSL